MFLVLTSAILAAWYLVYYYNWLRNVSHPLDKLPGYPRMPIVGTRYMHIGVPKEKLYPGLAAYVKKYGPIAKYWRSWVPEVHLSKPEHVKIVLNKHLTKSKEYLNFHPWVGKGLFTNDGAAWRQRRKFITPAFHYRILENYVPILAQKTQTLLQVLDSKCDGQVWDILPDINRYSLGVICETAMGVSIDAMVDEINEYLRAVHDFTDAVFWKSLRCMPDFLFRLTPHWSRYKKDLGIIHGFSERIIAERKEHRKAAKHLDRGASNADDLDIKKRNSFLDMLLDAAEDARTLSDKDIREEVDTFIFGGHDTVTAAISWVLWLLGNHQEIQEKVFEEVSSVLKDKPIPRTPSELYELKYLARVLKESLRLHPSAFMISRETVEELEIEGHQIPIGTQVAIHIYLLHKDPRYFPEPHKFDPDRFLPENCVGRHPYAYIPFSAGPRNCIGQKFATYEQKIAVASIIKRYKVVAIEPVSDDKMNPHLIMMPYNGVRVKLEKR